MNAKSINDFNTFTNDEIKGVVCMIDGKAVHSIPRYLADSHGDWSVDLYLKTYGKDLPLYSDFYRDTRAAKQDEIRAAAVQAIKPQANSTKMETVTSLFGLKASDKVKNAENKVIRLEVVRCDKNNEEFIPSVDNDFIHDAEVVTTIGMAFALNMPLYIHGFHGTGKTESIEQFCARTNRPMMRVQHTAMTEEAHILGQYVLKGGNTEFQPGPLAYAMRHGLTYLADEYDFAPPNVCSVYQPVLEGKALVIKDAPPEWRVVRPHPNFRFAATGNTNGGGDDTGLYQGTQIQNAANYSRFGVTMKMDYIADERMIEVLIERFQIERSVSTKIVNLASDLRKGFKNGNLSVPISPREVIGATRIGCAKGGDFKVGFTLAWANRLSSVDLVTASTAIQRTFP